MSLLLDQNLSHKLIATVSSAFPGSTHVRNVGLSTASDRDEWEYARDHGSAIVSKDSDFRQRSFVQGHPPKVIWIRMGNCTTSDIASLLAHESERIRTFLRDQEASFLVLDRA